MNLTVRVDPDVMPLGVLGTRGAPLIHPVFGGGLRLSLARFVNFCRAYPG
ncbi:MAG: hypothetical protein JO272_00940 [Pseudonocardiales bacterium]|nr:hypothetical protein [Pseudonocardiales bacterium]